MRKIQCPYERRIGGLMLHLRVGDVFTILGGEVVVQVHEICGNKVRLSIRGDRDKYPITRGDPEDYPHLLKSKGANSERPNQATAAIEPKETDE